MLYQTYDFNSSAVLDFERDVHTYYYGKIRGALRKSSTIVRHPRQRLESWEINSGALAYHLEVTYDIDRSDITTLLDNFENTYTEIEDLY